MRVSIIVTTKDKEETFKRSFNALINAANNLVIEIKDIEIIIVSPNEYPFINNYNNLPFNIILIKDELKGKPLALNSGIKIAQGDYVILTDGDVLLEKSSLKNIYDYIISQNLKIAGGKPVVLNKRDNMMGYWGWTLVEGNAHKIRKDIEIERINGQSVFFPASGYLIILAKDTFDNLSENTLVDDGYISFNSYKKGYSIGYCENALVYIKFPEKYNDYITQKVRTISGYQQGEISKSKSRSFTAEAKKGLINTLLYGENLKEMFWSVLLLLSRLHIWILVSYHTKIKRNFDLWKVIESSKGI